jgi:geranylgeranyl pyrophosphate synthase
VTAVLDASSAWLPARLAAVERELRQVAEGHGEALGEDARETLLAGGKRLRPMLVLLCAGPGAGPSAIRAATAIELVHMATLVHDDVLDRAELRRGRPTVASQKGRARATAVGDLLFSQAFALLASDGDAASVDLLSSASVALARGELAQSRDAYEIGIDEERYFERCRLKTAALFSCACLLGLTTSGADAGAAGREAIAGFGGSIGLAFQLLDDVLDIAGPPERTGKARGTDLLDGTVTLPLIDAARSDPAIRTADLRSLDQASAGELCDRIEATGALGRVRTRALAMVDDAKRQLAHSPFGEEQRRLLALVADGVVERYS